MNRHDWVFVGIRLLGVFFLAHGLVAFPVILLASNRSDAPLILDPLLRIAIGFVLAVFTDRICEWLNRVPRP